MISIQTYSYDLIPLWMILCSILFISLFYFFEIKNKNERYLNFFAYFFTLYTYITSLIISLENDYSIAYFFFSLRTFAPFIVIVGLISWTFFSQYYGYFFILLGVIFLVLISFFRIFNFFLDDGFFALFDLDALTFYFFHMMNIIFWILYIRILKPPIKISISSNDPKDW